MDQYQNPYSPVVSNVLPGQQTSNPVIQGLIRSVLYAAATITGPYLLVKSAIVVDSAIPGQGPFEVRTAMGICSQYFTQLAVLTMLAGFGAFSYYAGSRRINSAFCLVALAASGIVFSRLWYWMGPDSMKHFELEYPPVRPVELIAYFVSYLATSWLLVVVGRNSGRLIHKGHDHFR